MSFWSIDVGQIVIAVGLGLIALGLFAIAAAVDDFHAEVSTFRRYAQDALLGQFKPNRDFRPGHDLGYSSESEGERPWNS